MSTPILPDDHWIYSDDDHQDMPDVYIPTNRDVVKNAAKWAIKACTNNGKDMDFDPDALVNSLVRAICGST